MKSSIKRTDRPEAMFLRNSPPSSSTMAEPLRKCSGAQPLLKRRGDTPYSITIDTRRGIQRGPQLPLVPATGQGLALSLDFIPDQKGCGMKSSIKRTDRPEAMFLRNSPPSSSTMAEPLRKCSGAQPLLKRRGDTPYSITIDTRRGIQRGPQLPLVPATGQGLALSLDPRR